MSENIFDKLVQPTPESTATMSHESEAFMKSEMLDNQLSLAANTQEATNVKAKACVQELLRSGFIEQKHKKDLFQYLAVHIELIIKLLEPLDLSARLDDVRGIAVLTVADTTSDEWKHPLVRRNRLSLEQSLVVAILRQHFVISEQEGGLGSDVPVYSLRELLGQSSIYFGHSGSEAKDEKKILQILEQLRGYGIVSELNKHQEFEVRPLIAHLATPESLEMLLGDFKDARKADN